MKANQQALAVMLSQLPASRGGQSSCPPAPHNFGRNITGVVVAHQGAAPAVFVPGAEERLRVAPGAAFGEVVHHRLERIERARAIGPQLGAVRLAVAGLQHRHRRLVGT